MATSDHQVHPIRKNLEAVFGAAVAGGSVAVAQVRLIKGRPTKWLALEQSHATVRTSKRQGSAAVIRLRRARAKKWFSRARSISLSEHGSPVGPLPLPLFFQLRRMIRLWACLPFIGRSLVSSIPWGKSERLGEALRRLAVSPLAGRAYGLKSDGIGSHPLHI